MESRFYGLISILLLLLCGVSLLPISKEVLPDAIRTLEKPIIASNLNETAAPQLLIDPPKTDAEWEKILTADQYNILRKKGTEVPFSSPLDYETRSGTYYTADCHEPVFRSEQKYDSGTGWPSFWAPIKPDAVVLQKDDSLLVERTEVLSKCGGHLGHLFNDGPKPTGLRYCMNGDALIFIPDEESDT